MDTNEYSHPSNRLLAKIDTLRFQIKAKDMQIKILESEIAILREKAKKALRTDEGKIELDIFLENTEWGNKKRW